MPFYFRKSVTIGGIRLSFSKSGISYSASPIKGFRITTGQRGTYATVGSHGFYYRERLDKPTAPPRQGSNATSTWEEAPAQRADAIPTGDVSNFVDATSERMLKEINSRKSTMRTAPIIGGVCGLLSLLLLGNGFQIIGVITLIVSVVTTLLAAHYDRTQRTTLLRYDLENDLSKSKFDKRKRICEILLRSAKVWRVNSQQSTLDWKRNAGATSIVGRKQVVIEIGSPPCIETNIEVWSIHAGNTTLYFFPDYLFVLQNGSYGAIPYESLTARCSADRFIESSTVPRDAKVVGHTWQCVRKDGGPDKRFANNRQLPIALYGLLVMNSSSGLNIYLHCSNQETAKQVAEEIERANPQAAEQQREERERWERQRAEQLAEQELTERQQAEQRELQERAEQSAERQRAERQAAEELQQRAEDIALQGHARIARGDDDGAIFDCNQSIQIRPNHLAYWGRGMGFFENGNIDQAIADYTTAIEMNPNIGMIYYLRCVAYARLKEYENAIADARIADRLGIHNPEYHETAKQLIAAYDEEHRQRWEQQQAEQQQAEQQRAWKAAQSTVKSDYEVLGVSSNASDEQIDAAYRHLSQMHHPDKVEFFAAPEYKANSVVKMKEINAAYARLNAKTK